MVEREAKIDSRFFRRRKAKYQQKERKTKALALKNLFFCLPVKEKQ